MAMNKKSILGFVGIILLAGALAAYAALSPRYHATVMAPNALRTNAPLSMIAPAVNKVYEDIRLRHFMDAKGYAKFEDGTSTDHTKRESGSKFGDFMERVVSFDDPQGNHIVIRDYSHPEMGTLIVWEYPGAKDRNVISVILQQELARQGVSLR